jgi:hypothetical protein
MGPKHLNTKVRFFNQNIDYKRLIKIVGDWDGNILSQIFKKTKSRWTAKGGQSITAVWLGRHP